ncbi:MAG: GTP-binding protein EngB, partial [Candidatus Komeilibacteria bacterium]|nr:GTP-binding protein EngB [Candidatus Komeilibacteria bacterium]
RARQQERLACFGLLTNSEMTPVLVRQMCSLDDRGQQLIKQAVDSLHLSARSFHRLLKVSRTIADLAGEDNIAVTHLAEALQYRPRVE